MPWQEQSIMSQRRTFVALASQEGANVAALARRCGISRTTAYTWLARFAADGPAGLEDRSRRPHTSPRRTPATIEAQLLALREAHPAWGGRKLRARLLALEPGLAVPQPSTITALLRRAGLLVPPTGGQPRPWRRFEHEAPNALWQLDFKGHFALAQGRCHPLTVLDDHSRFNLGLRACANEQAATVRPQLEAIFRTYGLPDRLLMDNGSPWGSAGAAPYTQFTVWLLRLGIRPSHGRPHHPQTQGKEERFHRTLAAEALRQDPPQTLVACQDRFDHWRDVYNCERPHEALGLAVPASRYQPSPRVFPEPLPPVEYAEGEVVRRVGDQGLLSYRGSEYGVGQAFVGQRVALRPTTDEGLVEVVFCAERIALLDLRTQTAVRRPTAGWSDLAEAGEADR
jgi:transposase InsO family protein